MISSRMIWIDRHAAPRQVVVVSIWLKSSLSFLVRLSIREDDRAMEGRAMTAEIIPFRRPRDASSLAAEGPLPTAGRTSTPADTITLDAVLVDAPMKAGTVAASAMKLIAACQEMSASLAILSAHCASADRETAEIGSRAAAVATDVGAMARSVDQLRDDPANVG
jgi:hypothetical protein